MFLESFSFFAFNATFEKFKKKDFLTLEIFHIH